MTKKELSEKTGDFWLDVAKLCIAGGVFSSIFDDSMSKISTLIYGASATVVFMAIGYYFLYKSFKK
jgi:hypothetical protein